jgi:hypothetical protein
MMANWRPAGWASVNFAVVPLLPITKEHRN